MSQLTSLENRIKELEQSITQSLINHNGLVGMLKATKDALDLATRVADVVVPGTPVDVALEAIDKVVDEVGNG